MSKYADPLRCPDCHGPLVTGSSRCPGCGLELSGPIAQELFVVLCRADHLLGRLRERSASHPSQPSHPSHASHASHASPPAAGHESGTEAASPGQPHVPAAAVRTISVPQILLGLGAICILVAAVVFLAVTWTLLGVGGRTATLVALTVVSGTLAGWLARKGLRGATEALGLVTIGLAVLDLIGARNAGWLGDLGDPAFAASLGGLLVAGGLAATKSLERTPVRQLAVGELTAVSGALLVTLGLLAGDWASLAARQLTALLLVGAVTACTWRLVRAGESRFRGAAWGMAAITVADWLVLLAAGLARLGSHPSAASVWAHLDGWPLLATTLTALAASLQRRLPRLVRVAAVGAALVPLSIAVTAPAYDEGPTVRTLAVLAAVAGLATLVALAPRPWAASGLGAAVLGSAYLAFRSLRLLDASAARYADAVDRPWGGTAGGRLPTDHAPTGAGEAWLLPLCVLTLVVVLAAALRLLETGRGRPSQRLLLLAAVPVGGSLVAALLLLPVPVWTVLGTIMAAAIGAWTLHLRWGDPATATTGALALAAALPLSLYDEHLTATALAVTLAVLVAGHLRSPLAEVGLSAGVLSPLVLAALVWTVGEITVGTGPWVALTGLLALAAVALTGVHLRAPGRSRAAVASLEVGALLAAPPLAGAGVAAAGWSTVWTAVYLTVAGLAATSLSLLRADRRRVGWLGGALLALATWVRLGDLGVEQPEPYTLPSAVALLVVGWVHLRRNPSTSTHKALGPGLALALVPSLLWLVEDPLGLRAVLLGLACLAMVAAGTQLRLAAPFVHGATVGLLVVLREAAPFIGETVPRWSLIGAAGVLLIALGASWEQRLHQARAMSAFVSRMR